MFFRFILFIISLNFYHFAASMFSQRLVIYMYVFFYLSFNRKICS